MKNIFLFLLFSVSVLISGCASQEEDYPLAGKTFKFADKKGHQAVITFNIDKTVSGSSGVNRFFGKYQAAGEELALYQMGATRMAGDPEAMKFEDKFMNSLGRVNRFCEIRNTLILFDGERPVLELELKLAD